MDERGEIGRLLDEVTEAVQSEANAGRAMREPAITWALEEPITPVRLLGLDIDRLCTDPAYFVAQNLRLKLWRWHEITEDTVPISLDLPVWLGHYPDFTYIGLSVEFDRRGVPQLQTDHPIKRDPDLSLLQPVDFYRSGWMPRVLRWYDDVRTLVGDRMDVSFAMQWRRGPLDLAIQFRGYEGFINDTVERPQFLHDLMKFITEQRCRWWEAYWAHYGLAREPTDIHDDWINVPFITPTMFEDFCLPRYLELEQFHGSVSNLHSCGNKLPLLPSLLRIRTLVPYEVNHWTDLAGMVAGLPPDKKLVIWTHANDVICATDEQMAAQVEGFREACAGRRYSVGTSGVTPITDDMGRFSESINRWLRAAKHALWGV